jgi:hypothetical protein
VRGGGCDSGYHPVLAVGSDDLAVAQQR